MIFMNLVCLMHIHYWIQIILRCLSHPFDNLDISCVSNVMWPSIDKFLDSGILWACQDDSRPLDLSFGFHYLNLDFRLYDLLIQNCLGFNLRSDLMAWH